MQTVISLRCYFISEVQSALTLYCETEQLLLDAKRLHEQAPFRRWHSMPNSQEVSVNFSHAYIDFYMYFG